MNRSSSDTEAAKREQRGQSQGSGRGRLEDRTVAARGSSSGGSSSIDGAALLRPETRLTRPRAHGGSASVRCQGCQAGEKAASAACPPRFPPNHAAHAPKGEVSIVPIITTRLRGPLLKGH